MLMLCVEIVTLNNLLFSLASKPFLGGVRGGEFLLLAKFGAIRVIHPHGGEGSDSL